MSELEQSSSIDARKTVSDEADDPLRLTFCPNCDYSLETLPKVGTCPECGEKYDDQFVIFQDDFGKDSEPKWKRLARQAGMIFAGCVLIGWIWNGAFKPDSSTLAWFVALGILCAIDGRGWLMSASRPRQQLWMNEHGFEFVRSSPEARLAKRTSNRIIFWLVPVFFVVAIGFATTWSDRFCYLAVGSVITIGAWRVRAQVRREEKLLHQPIGSARRLIPWSLLNRCEVRQNRPNRVRIRLQRVTKVPMFASRFHHQEDANLETACTSQQFTELQRRMTVWTAGRCTARDEAR